jgi:hypothetical protein
MYIIGSGDAALSQFDGTINVIFINSAVFNVVYVSSAPQTTMQYIADNNGV